jgi:ubiquinone/menaquinone biosynthesis C-methylase UbiE
MRDENIFDKYAQEYDAWFDENRYAYLSEVELLKSLMPGKTEALEIGVGSGRFAAPLGISLGVDPSRPMLEMACKRRIETLLATGEDLPFRDQSFDLVLLIVTLCYVNDTDRVIREAQRVLREKGKIIAGIIDRKSELGKIYQARKDQSRFYRPATFLSAEEVMALLEKHAFQKLRTFQTISQSPRTMTSVESFEPGHGRGGFVVIEGEKPERKEE